MFPLESHCSKAHLVLETGEVFSGLAVNETLETQKESQLKPSLKGHPKWDVAGEVVFNTSHSGYEEIATDPSYYSQILVMTASMQGNYGAYSHFWESNRIWIRGFICLELSGGYLNESLFNHDLTQVESSWARRLLTSKVPILTHVDTREIVLRLREKGVAYGALVKADKLQKAKEKARQIILKAKSQDPNWPHQVCCKQVEVIPGHNNQGVKVAILDFGCKKNIVRELKKICKEIALFPYYSSEKEIRDYNPEGILLSNGPGDPAHVPSSVVETLKSLLGWRFIFGICMGHQILSLALGGKTYRLPFGHRGSNHPVKDLLLSKIYVTSQNHGYAVDKNSLPPNVQITHVNLNDQTLSGIYSEEQKCMGIQFHPESSPGTHDAKHLFPFFSHQIKKNQ